MRRTLDVEPLRAGLNVLGATFGDEASIDSYDVQSLPSSPGPVVSRTREYEVLHAGV